MGFGFRLQHSIYSTTLLLQHAPSLQPQQRQHFVNKSFHLTQLILRCETQHRRGDTHVDPFLNQAGRSLSAARAPARL